MKIRKRHGLSFHQKIKKGAALILISAVVLSLGACRKAETADGKEEIDRTPEAEEKIDQMPEAEEEASTLAVNMEQWNYDEEHNVYWQIGLVYCSRPETEEYESLGIYVPGDYLNGTKNSDGTYSCTINEEGEINGYTAATAPIVLPVNTAGYSAQKAPSSYNYQGLSGYLDAGFIYVYAGCRGRSNGYDSDGTLIYNGGAPWGVTDLKAAVRYLRYNAGQLPGDTDRIFTFGHSGGGAQSSLMGATGDSELYFDYLNSIGAAMYDENGNYISDAICGAMCWCPITSLDTADAAYEWMMGQYSDTGTRAEDTFTSALSKDLANAYAEYINSLGLSDEEGNVLTLMETEDGVYTAGTYYDYLLSEIERSLNQFLSDTEFPYTVGGTSEKPDGGFGGSGSDSGFGTVPDTGMPPEGSLPELTEGELPEGSLPERKEGELPEGGLPEEQAGEKTMEKGEEKRGQIGQSEKVTYETAEDYIEALNQGEAWIEYDKTANTATVTSIEAFVAHCKNASKSVGAFDDLNRSQAENLLFGDSEQDALHFDAILAELLMENQEEYAAFSDWDASYVQAYAEYKNSQDAMGTSSETRQNMYNPMYYLMDYYEGYQTSKVAPYWRIHTGIDQGDTALTVEMNLALALRQYEGVETVDFETVWEQGHTTAERTGDSTTNLIAWINACCAIEN